MTKSQETKVIIWKVAEEYMYKKGSTEVAVLSLSGGYLDSYVKYAFKYIKYMLAKDKGYRFEKSYYPNMYLAGIPYVSQKGERLLSNQYLIEVIPPIKNLCQK